MFVIGRQRGRASWSGYHGYIVTELDSVVEPILRIKTTPTPRAADSFLAIDSLTKFFLVQVFCQ